MYETRNGMAAAELKYEVIVFFATSSFIFIYVIISMCCTYCHYFSFTISSIITSS